MDGLLKEGRITFKELYFMKRVSLDNQWVQVAWGEISEARFGEPYSHGNAIMIGAIEKD